MFSYIPSDVYGGQGLRRFQGPGYGYPGATFGITPTPAPNPTQPNNDLITAGVVTAPQNKLPQMMIFGPQTTKRGQTFGPSSNYGPH